MNSLLPILPREEALARAAELDAALHRAMRERGEELIPARHAQYLTPVDRCATCGGRVSCKEPIALINGVLFHGACR